jgi:hypothetical protein
MLEKLFTRHHFEVNVCARETEYVQKERLYQNVRHDRNKKIILATSKKRKT